MTTLFESEDWKCPLDQTHGDIVCRDGVLMAMTFSEMGPTESRVAIDECYYCERHKRELLKQQQRDRRKPA